MVCTDGWLMKNWRYKCRGDVREVEKRQRIDRDKESDGDTRHTHTTRNNNISRNLSSCDIYIY